MAEGGGDQETASDFERSRSAAYDDRFYSFIDVQTLTYKIKQPKGGILLGLNQYIKESFYKWKLKKIKVAVTGQSGSGKSSLVNALRGLKANDKDAAPVNVTESLVGPTKYSFPNKTIVLWDLPGIGTEKYPKSEITLENLGFSKFNVLIIVTATRFTENDIWLAERGRELRKYVVFVRSKISIDLSNLQADFPDKFRERETLELFKSDIISQTQKSASRPALCDSDDIFLIDSRTPEKFDFKLLQNRITQLPEKKGLALRTLLEIEVRKQIEENKQMTYEDFKLEKAAAVVLGFLPIPNLESHFSGSNVQTMSNECLKRCNLDIDSIKTIAIDLKKASYTIVEKQLKVYNPELNIKCGKELRKTTENKKWNVFMQHAKYLAPVVGSALSAAKEMKTVVDCLTQIADTMAVDQTTVATMLLDKLEKDLDRKEKIKKK